MAKLIEQYLKDSKLHLPHCNEYPLFLNNEGNKLTRSGIVYILKKYQLTLINRLTDDIGAV